MFDRVKLFYRLAILLPLLAVVFVSCASRQSASFQDGPLFFEEPFDSDPVPVPAPAPAPVPAPAPEVPIVIEMRETVPIVNRSIVYEELLNTVWMLAEIQVNYGKMVLDRAAMAINGMGDVYTIQLTEEGINGKAAPNRFHTTFELRYNHDFRLRPIAGTMMASNINIGGLMENEYYWYLQRVTHWEIVNNVLELYAHPSPSDEFVMRFLRQ
jgi:hypothetical protein